MWHRRARPTRAPPARWSENRGMTRYDAGPGHTPGARRHSAPSPEPAAPEGSDLDSRHSAPPPEPAAPEGSDLDSRHSAPPPEPAAPEGSDLDSRHSAPSP